MYCEIVYFIEENNCEKRHADLKPRGYNCFWIDPDDTSLGIILGVAGDTIQLALLVFPPLSAVHCYLV